MKEYDLQMIIGTIAFIFFGYYFYISAIKDTKLLIESFEGKINVDTVDFGSSANSKMSATGTSKFSKCGIQSLKLSYDLKPSGYVYCAKGYGLYHVGDSSTWNAGRPGWIVHPDKISWYEYDAFNIYLRSEDSIKVAIDIKDSGGELWRHMIYVKSGGWKKFSIPFEEFSQRTDWQPDTAVRNGFMDFPITSFQIEPKDPGRNTLYADCVSLTKQ